MRTTADRMTRWARPVSWKLSHVQKAVSASGSANLPNGVVVPVWRASFPSTKSVLKAKIASQRPRGVPVAGRFARTSVSVFAAPSCVRSSSSPRCVAVRVQLAATHRRREPGPMMKNRLCSAVAWASARRRTTACSTERIVAAVPNCTQAAGRHPRERNSNNRRSVAIRLDPGLAPRSMWPSWRTARAGKSASGRGCLSLRVGCPLQGLQVRPAQPVQRLADDLQLALDGRRTSSAE